MHFEKRIAGTSNIYALVLVLYVWQPDWHTGSHGGWHFGLEYDGLARKLVAQSTGPDQPRKSNGK